MSKSHADALTTVPLDEAYDRLWSALEKAGAAIPLAGELVAVSEALGRVTAAPVWAKVSSPNFHASAMDGVAVESADTVGASDTCPVILRVGTQATWVDTGDPLPATRDAVVMLEHLQKVRDDAIEIRRPAAPWQHVRRLGEDIVATELVIPESRRLSPVDLGAIAASGHASVLVRKQPRVAILPTGTELVPPGTEMKPGDIVEFNSIMLAAQVREWGGIATVPSALPDHFATVRQRVLETLDDHDAVVINAGSSAGSADFTAAVVRDLGSLVVHGVAIRPGHPVVLGVCKGKPVLGLPGYPVAAVLTSELFLCPLVYRLLGLPAPERPRLTATLSHDVPSLAGTDEFVRITLGQVGDRLIATPLKRGAGATMSLVRADGQARVSRWSEGVSAGSPIEVELLRPHEDLQRTIVAVGSDDLALDLLASMLARHRPGLALSLTNVGSLEGLLALQRGEAHLVGSHLLDEETGEYNLPHVRRLLNGRSIVIVTLAYREQGFIIPVGNPKRIRGLHDLVRADVQFVNRQRGSGTGVLLDYRLRELGIEPARIRGYEREVPTHFAVAADVMSGAADVGVGILAVARALNLDFIPIAKERYDLVIPRDHYTSDLLRPLLSAIRSDDFRERVDDLGGYDTADMGRVTAEIG